MHVLPQKPIGGIFIKFRTGTAIRDASNYAKFFPDRRRASIMPLPLPIYELINLIAVVNSVKFELNYRSHAVKLR